MTTKKKILEVKLASVILHLVEFQITREPADETAVDGLLGDEDVHQFLKSARSDALLPVPRSSAVYERLGIR